MKFDTIEQYMWYRLGERSEWIVREFGIDLERMKRGDGYAFPHHLLIEWVQSPTVYAVGCCRRAVDTVLRGIAEGKRWPYCDHARYDDYSLEEYIFGRFMGLGDAIAGTLCKTFRLIWQGADPDIDDIPEIAELRQYVAECKQDWAERQTGVPIGEASYLDLHTRQWYEELRQQYFRLIGLKDDQPVDDEDGG